MRGARDDSEGYPLRNRGYCVSDRKKWQKECHGGYGVVAVPALKEVFVWAQAIIIGINLLGFDSMPPMKETSSPFRLMDGPGIFQKDVVARKL